MKATIDVDRLEKLVTDNQAMLEALKEAQGVHNRQHWLKKVADIVNRAEGKGGDSHAVDL